MKLSTAIRIGSMTTKQIKSIWDDGKNGRCALGAACDAVGYRTTHMDTKCFLTDKHIQVLFPILSAIVSSSPCYHFTPTLGDKITHLNDFHDWSRERIADWVESVENSIEKVQPAEKGRTKEYAA